ncbi:MAG: NUDIX domain-containing protein, partial [Halieaceae bacterium]|nr:NUDIX domain-containing protein [Halieaceae bacterium]
MPDAPRFLPHTTVASVIERSGRFLLVEEVSQGVTVLNQPAGHLEQYESLIDAAARETLEETCWRSEITAYLGVTIVTGKNG